MGIFIDILIALSLLAVLGSLFMGLITLARGGDYAAANSNRFMQWRVKTQAVAIVLLLLGFWYKATHP
jgi:Hypoxia induced protein conserved region